MVVTNIQMSLKDNVPLANLVINQMVKEDVY